MVRSLFLLLFLVLQLAAPGPLFAAQGILQPETYFSQIAQRFARRFPDEHVNQTPLDDTISARAWRNYLNSLDSDHVYFLASDIAAFKVDELNLDDQLDNGDLTFAYSVFDIFKQRVKDRAEYVSGLLSAGIDMEKDETYKWRRKDEPWAKDKAEWDELWRKRTKNEYVRRIVAKELARKPAPEADKKEEQKKDVGEPANIAPLSPDEAIRKQNKQFITVLDDADPSWVLEKYLSAFAHAYDPHSDYMSAGAMEEFDIEMTLSLVGIGAVLNSDEDGSAKVIRLIEGGPAHIDKRDIRLKPGDRIIAVGEGDQPPIDIRHWPLRKIVDRIRGEKGSKVVLTVIPASDLSGSTTKTVDLIRDDVKLEDQAASWKMREIKGSDGVSRRLGVISLPSFYANMKQNWLGGSDSVSCCSDVEKLLGEMRTNSIEGVIIDLRYNGGGSLTEVVKMVGLFIGRGPVVQVKERSPTRKVLGNSDPRVAYSGPLVVLVNRLSASASEILAGALQDYGRAILVGDSKTHGKGTVQTILDMGRDPKYGAIRITTAMYFRISGSSTQLKGVAADIVIPSPVDCMEFGEEFMPNPMEWNRINAAAYLPNTGTTAIIPVLAGKSEKRRADDPRFVTYMKFLDQIRALWKTDEMPLGLAARKKLAQTEKDLKELEDEIADEADAEGKDNRDKNNDLVLSEGLQILSDYIQLGPKTIREQESVPVEGKGFLDLMREWLGD